MPTAVASTPVCHRSALSIYRRDLRNGWYLKIALVAPLCFLLISTGLIAQSANSPASVGKWQVLSNTLPLNPVHAAVMRTGKVLMIDSSDTTNPLAAVWDPATQKATTFATSYIMF